jgi:hypothetical protein
VRRSILDVAFTIEVLHRARQWERAQIPTEETEEKGRLTVLEDDSKRMHREWLEQLPDDVRASLGY